MLFARWIDLGCPINFGSGGSTPYGWFLDEVRPTLALSVPRPGANTTAVSTIRVGIADAHGLAPGSLSITADFVVAARPAGSELVDLAQPVGGDIFVIDLGAALAVPFEGQVFASVTDIQGNVTRVNRQFSTTCAGTGGGDPDGDGIDSSCDNCPGDANADQADLDFDGAGDACDADDDGDAVADASDCAPLDASVWSTPSDITTLVFLGADKQTLAWRPTADPGGAIGVSHDVIRTNGDPGFSGAVGVVCDTTDVTAIDSTTSAGLLHYLVRARNPCGGTLGSHADGTPRPALDCASAVLEPRSGRR